jgi:hypothetical protein
MDYGSEFLPLVDYFDENAVTPLKELVCVATEQVEENKEEMEVRGTRRDGLSVTSHYISLARSSLQ